MAHSEWSLVSELKLETFTWDDESVIYNLASGDTHHLNSSAHWVLEQLQLRAMSVANLTSAAVTEGLMDDDNKTESLLEETLKQLQDIDLLVYN